MSSSSTLPNKYFNRLQVNRLQALNSNIVNDDQKSFLYSLLIDNATFKKNNIGGTLTFSSGDVDSIIQFSDRPFRQTGFISIYSFIDLFSELGINTFTDSPPNGVLVSGEEQKTYEIKTVSEQDSSGKYTIELELLPGESHVGLDVVSGQVSLFVDNSSTNAQLIDENQSEYVNISNQAQYVDTPVPVTITKSDRTGYTYMLTFEDTDVGKNALTNVMMDLSGAEFITSMSSSNIYKMGNDVENISGYTIYSDITYNGSDILPFTNFTGTTYWKYIN